MPFSPGYSGNPRGRPKKGESLTDALHMVLSVRENRMALAQKVYELALDGNVPAMNLIWERVDGKVPDESKFTHEIGDTLAGALRDALRR